MNSLKQKTIKDILVISGIGVHSGTISTIKIKPSNPNTGIVFIKNNQIINAKYNSVINTFLGTNIGICNFFQKFLINLFNRFGYIKTYGIIVRTIEHLMSALWACDIDNAIIEIDNNEIPIMDGSAIEFINKILKVGIFEQNEKKKFLIIKKLIQIYEKDKFLKIFPYNSFRIDMKIDFSYGGIGIQTYTFNGKKEEFIQHIASARTFGNVEDYSVAIKHNLSKGSDLNNTVVFNKIKCLNQDGLRYSNEPCRHKILDCIGDMYSSGYNIKGYIQAYKSGHTLNNKLLRKIFSNKENYEIE